MKGIFISLVAFFMAISVSSQNIQTKFFGNSFGSSMQEMMFSIDECKKEDYNKLSVMNQRFGGYSWDFVDFRYTRNKLYNVNFSKYYENKGTALSFFNKLKSQLEEKYKSLYISDMDLNVLGVKDVFITDSYSSLFLHIDHSKSKGGRMYYYVDINYYDCDLWRIAIEEDNNEL